MTTRDRIHDELKRLIMMVIDLVDDPDVVPQMQQRAARVYRKLDEARTALLFEVDAGPTQADIAGEVDHA
jgi:hypothetical protein